MLFCPQPFGHKPFEFAHAISLSNGSGPNADESHTRHAAIGSACGTSDGVEAEQCIARSMRG
jgi:hypothetical protein